MIKTPRVFGVAMVLTAMLASSAQAEPQRRARNGQRGREPVPVGTDESTGPIEIKSVRMKQGSSGFYVTSGGSYNFRPGTPVDLDLAVNDDHWVWGVEPLCRS